MPLTKRKLFGPLWAPLVRLRHSDTARRLKGLARLPAQYRRFHANRPYLAADVGGRTGMGATLAHALTLYDCAERAGLIPVIVSTNPLYAPAPGEDCLSPFFGAEPAKLAGRELTPLRYETPYDTPFLRLDQAISLSEASRLFWKYLAPRASVMEVVERLAGDEGFDLSIHYRGADKLLEASPAGFAAFDQALLAHRAGGGGMRRVFLATDHPPFETQLRERYPQTEFRTYNLGEPSGDPWARHFSDLPPYDKAMEAAVNIMLLARAPICIRSTSFMSAMSKVANPSLRTITLNRPFASLFPEQGVIDEEKERECA